MDIVQNKEKEAYGTSLISPEEITITFKTDTGAQVCFIMEIDYRKSSVHIIALTLSALVTSEIVSRMWIAMLNTNIRKNIKI